MTPFDPAVLAGALAVAGLIIVLASLTSGLVERSGVPAVAAFLLLGLVLGPHGLGLFDFNLTDPALGTVATISLVLVLFTDALGVDREGINRHRRLAALVLGPGTLVVTLLVAVAGWALLGLEPAHAAILGAALASTDPVMMRGLIRRPGVPASARAALGLESGLNDLVVLPVVLVAMAFLGARGSSLPAAGTLAFNILVIGPVVGVAIGFVTVRLLETMRRRYGLRRDYESLYVLGVALTAFATAETLHSSGFMAAFAAGLTINQLDVELCDCFHDYGEATSEMFLLFAFVAFGTSLIWTGFEVVSLATLAFAVIALFARSLVLAATLPRDLDRESRRMIVWFGPRGLSSLLLVLLPLFASIAGAERLFPVCALVVLLSLVFHGGVSAFLGRRLSPTTGSVTALPGADRPAAALPAVSVADRLLIHFEELDGLIKAGAPVRILDVRANPGWEASEVKAAGAIRLPPDRPVESAAALALPKHDWLVAYCA